MALTKLSVIALLALNAHALIFQAAPAPAAAGSPGAPGAPGGPEIQYSKDFQEDWHNEWRHGDFPSWKKVIKVDGIEGWEDRQSDGKPGFLQAAAPAASPAGSPAGEADMTYPEEEWKKDWHKEWKKGDFPTWKETIKVDGI